MTVMIIILMFLVVTAIFGFVLYDRVLTHLQHEHEGTWIALGSPRLTLKYILVNVIRGHRSIQRFLWKREFEAFADENLERKCEMLRWFIILFAIGCPFLLLLAAN